jgi:hypothetical protein
VPELLTQNSELRPLGIFNWTIPAFVVQLSNGKHMNVCPNAGVCASVCYARNGTYNFPSVKQAHTTKLEWYLNDPEDLERRMITEINGRQRYRGGKWVRIHDSGDFFSEPYLLMWLRIAKACPDVTFYCYTKEVAMFRRVVERGVEVRKTPEGRFIAETPDGKQFISDHPEISRRVAVESIDPDAMPRNFKYIFSMGGKQDDMLDKEVDRHAEIFSTFKKLWEAGYDDQEDDDRQCVTNSNIKVGIVENNIPAFKKKLGGKTFGELQHERDAARFDKIERRRLERLAADPETAATV